ncbi:MAG: glycosyltransferase 87 family protein [Solirubrobacteraceae bacterium]
MAGVRYAVGVIRRAAGLLALAGLLWSALLIVTAAASHPLREVPARLGGFPGWLRGPLSGTGYLLRPSQFATLVLVMAAWYLLALACAPALRAGWTIGAVVLLHVVFLLGPPLISSDVFGYLDWARMDVLHALNPYVTASGSVPSDPVYGFLSWHRGVSPYGPLFTVGSYALAPLGVPAGLWALKLLVTLSSLGCVALIWAGARTLARPPLPGILLYGANPAVLVYAVGGFHNDTITTAAIVGAVYLVLRGRERAGALVGAAAVALKSSAGVVMPFLVLGARDRWRALLAAVVGAAAALALALAAFGSHAFGFLHALSDQENRNSGTSVAAQLGALFGWVGSPPPVRLAASVIGVLVILALLVRTWRGSDWVASAGWATLAVMVTSAYLLPWYIVWLVPLAALGASRALRVASVAMTLFVILVRLVPELQPTSGPPVTAASALSAVVMPLEGGPQQPARTSLGLHEPLARAFERAWEAERRMKTGRDFRPVRRSSSRCRALEPDPGPRRDQRWSCRVSYLTRAGARGRASYLVALDPRACFTATSRDHPAQVFERVLARPAANPLAHFRSCP